MSAEGWNHFKFEDICTKIGSGATPTGGANAYKNAGISLIRSQNVRDFSFSNEGLAFIDDEQAEKLKSVTVSSGDVLLNITGDSVARSCIVTDEVLPARVNQHVSIIRVNESLSNNKFVFYYTQHIKPYLLSLAGNGATRNALTKAMIEQLDILLPPLPEQRAIAATLSALDDKIELNNRINKTLEEMAQALFKRWFVDFEFPDENDQPYKSSGGELVESELGLIPKGWKLASLDSIADYLNGLAMQKYRPEGDEFIPVIKIRELNQGKSDAQSDKASPKIDSKYIVNDGDVLFSWSGSLDVKIWCGGKGGLNQHLFKVTSGRYEKWFYYLWTKHHLEKFRGIAQDKATTMGHIQRKHLQESFAATPDHDCLERMNSVMRPIFDAYITGAIEAATLVAIRDTILPKLISGEIRVNGSLAEDIGNGEG